MLHVPRNEELFLIQKILEFHKDVYVVFRITQTMLNKSKIVIILFTYLYKKIELINLARFYLNVLLST